MTDNKTAIRDAFEACLIKAMTGEPILNKEGEPVVDPATGEIILGAPEASLLSVVRAYLKDTQDDKPPLPKTGEPKGLLAGFKPGAGLPFGTRAN